MTDYGLAAERVVSFLRLRAERDTVFPTRVDPVVTSVAFGDEMIAITEDDLRALIAAARERDEMIAAISKWAATNEIAAPPLDWAWLGEILRRFDRTHEGHDRG